MCERRRGGVIDARCRGGGEGRERFLVFLVKSGDAGLLRVEGGGPDRGPGCVRGARDVPQAFLGGLVWIGWIGDGVEGAMGGERRA